ncbi:ABC drug exporter AtrF [Xylariomycetidae sp. FL0641]|nr:ABC drug exporter AtrF [Xylariomycetidae sp. FL0641]
MDRYRLGSLRLTSRGDIRLGNTQVDTQFAPIRAGSRPVSGLTPGSRPVSALTTEDELFQVLSRRRSAVSGIESEKEQDEVEKLMARMFGESRQQGGKPRHSGVVFRNLTVKGVGLGASLQPTVGDVFTALPRALRNLVRAGPRAAGGKPPIREILSGFDGCVRPGEMLLVLGRPGAGCTTFLKTFCNQRAGYAAVLGDVSYGGLGAARMARDFRGEVIYNPEEDLHYAALSVRRTLGFALRTRTPGREERRAGESRADYVREFLRVAAKLLWIEHTMDTKVGNEYVRGVSGGERKRVSIAEALVTRASVQGWDNSSKGLDASTAAEYVQSLRAMTNMARASTAVSLYQAGESLYALFDKVLVIDEGRCLYFGPADAAKRYFVDLGLDCPERWTTADFLTSVTDPHERSVRPGCEARVPRSAEEFGAVYRDSEAYRRNLADIAEYEEEVAQEQRLRHHPAGEKRQKQKQNYTIGFHEQVLALAQRQLLVMWGDKASLMGKWGAITFQGLIVGSLFFQQPATTAGAFTRGGVLFFILLFNALLALAEQTAAFQAKPILLKHKNFSFYRPSAFAVAQVLVDVPAVLIQVLLFDIIIYWMAGLSATPSQFFISILILWMVTMTTYAFFRALSAVFKTLDDATKVTGVAIQILIVYTGYLIPPADMKPWFAWLRFINWVQYGFECLMSNEFYNLEMKCVGASLVPNGPGISPEYQTCALAGSVPGSDVVSGAAYIEQSFGYTRAHLWRNFGFLWAFFLFFLAIAMVGMEFAKPNAGGASVTLFKRGQVPKQVEQSIETGGRRSGQSDEESARTGEKPVPVGEEDTTAEMAEQTVAKNEKVFTFQNINYTIPWKGGRRKLLQDVSGLVKPGKLTALMGASGAGKTTLLNTLAQRITTGTITGDFLVDGRPLPKSFQRATGFAEQQDIHEPTATVREALRFSALLRQPRAVPVAEKYAYCETILELLEMGPLAGAVVGRAGCGLNAEQRKRLTLGVELAARPALLLFLDEPTSGLDSGAAANIVRFLRKLADAGQAVLCTIHQPSAVLFAHFDELVLLKAGGRVAYAGPLGRDSRDLIAYFEENAAAAAAAAGGGGQEEEVRCPPAANPAEWMLEVIGAGNPDYRGPDWADVWAGSRQCAALQREIESVVTTTRQRASGTSAAAVGLADDDDDDDEREYAMPLSAQVSAVVKRAFVSYWRSPKYVQGKLFLHVLTGLVNCFTFYKVGASTVDMQSRLFSIFLVLTIAPPLIQQLQPQFLRSRAVFASREDKAKIYGWTAWIAGAVAVEVPYALVAGAVYYNCWWWGLTGYQKDGFASGFAFLCVLLFELYYTGFGQMIAAVAPNELLASLLVPVFFLFVVSFCGVSVPPANLPHFWHAWMYWLTPFHYLLEAFLATAVHGQPVRCTADEFARFPAPPGQSCQDYVAAYIDQVGGYVQTAADGVCEYCQYKNGDEFGASFSVYYSHIWRNFGIVCGFIAFNYIVVFLATWLRFRGRNPVKAVMSKRKQGKA